MKYTHRTARSVEMWTLMIMVFTAVTFTCASIDARADEKPAAEILVNAADLHSGRAKIIGYLGRPMGETITIRVEAYAPPGVPKDSARLLRITRLNGNELGTPLKFESHWLHPFYKGGTAGDAEKPRWDWKAHLRGKLAPPKIIAGDVWEMQGVEASHTIPHDNSTGATLQSPPWLGAAGFYTTFEFLAARRSGKNDNNPAPTPKTSLKKQP